MTEKGPLNMKIILASKSPRRKELLEKLGLEFEIRSAPQEEEMDPNKDVVSEVGRVSAAKALSVPASDDELVISSDTVVDLDGVVLGKPVSEEEARRMLASLSGRGHVVHTAVTVKKGDRIRTEVSSTAVWFRELTDGEIDAYVRSGEPMDKAGAYGAQGLGSLLVQRIDGDFFTVMGLPVCTLGQMLKEFGVDIL